ncbi:Transducin/WD40 repeat-like superfamily protein [Zea mays]|uniref:Transducin/WD40 repeat-like superfamily protein n=1 Tax=Zea mays TaxID=4577 RepID=A0A1D6MHF4_MAIZE|nr:Transducin/WD40 repeat-like superfamily protein [Zea mays]
MGAAIKVERKESILTTPWAAILQLCLVCKSLHFVNVSFKYHYMQLSCVFEANLCFLELISCLTEHFQHLVRRGSSSFQVAMMHQ